MNDAWRVLLVLMAGLLSVKAAETPSSLAQDYSVTVFDQEAGLSHFALASLAQTPDGRLWYSTFGTLGRFDGTRFDDIGAESSPALEKTWTRELFLDRRGRLWVGGDGRILCQETNGWRLFGAREGVPSGMFRSLAQDAQGRIWAASESNIVRLAGGRFEAVPTPQGRQEWWFSVAADRDGTVWCASTLYLGRFEEGRWVTILNEAQTLTNRIMGMRAARPDGLLLGFQQDIKLWRDGRWARVWSRPEGFRGDALHVVQDSRGNLWAGGWSTGLIVYGAHGQVRQATTREGLASNSISDLAEDSEGNIWLTSDGGGLARLRPLAFHSYGTESGLAQVANCVAEEAPGRMLVGTHGDGLVKWEAGRVGGHELWTEVNRPEGPYVYSVLRDRQGGLWAGCYLAGLNRLVQGSWEGIPATKTGADTIQALFEDREGRVWIGTVAGLAVMERGEFRVCGREDGSPRMTVHGIGQDSAGDLWVCGVGYGLFRRQAGRFTRYSVPGLETNAPCLSLLGGRDGSLWVGTSGRGLCRIQGDTCFVYGERQGLPPMDISGILEDDAGHLWLGGPLGVVRLIRDSLELVVRQPEARLVCQVFDKRDGLPAPVRAGFQPVCCKASDGRLWFATARGLAVVDPKLIPLQPPPPTVVMDGLLVDHKLRADWNGPGERLRLPPTSRHIDPHYSVVRLGTPERIRFQHRLHPTDEWRDAGKSRLTEFHDLPPDRYQFEVRAADNDGRWGTPAALAFEVMPYYWQTASFRLAVLMVVGSLVWGVYRWRVASLEKRRQAQADISSRLIRSQEEERKRIAAELHDSVGQDLLVIKNRALLGLQETGATAHASEQFDEISRTASHTLEEVRAISRNLRPYQIDRLGLTKTLEATVANVLSSSGIPCIRRLDPLDGLLAPSLEIHLYRIVQELLNNVVKHSDASECRLQAAHQAGRVVLTLDDDGRGFDFAAAAGSSSAGEGLGLSDIAERVRILGGTAKCESQPGHGTRWRIEIPVDRS